tara:strand:+ start:2041 stop:2211 length:171 start_codon:yes stop_codon:yes gene_type:complete
VICLNLFIDTGWCETRQVDELRHFKALPEKEPGKAGCFWVGMKKNALSSKKFLKTV